ncbi:MAG TPA: sigma-70 family RNA polymerase sigma factor [Phycisphaerae bacterium]|nr:sigma-70 family RNA polymerase sigma factor [Phycisphaerae bacterium]HRW51794.1 sigma-70 family RNA polymerase sigma factor [Phycisphaerae bacterium]
MTPPNRNTQSTTSLTLLESLREGSQPAWRLFFDRYASMLFSIARRLGLNEIDAQDAVQETLIAVHRAFSSMEEPFDRQSGRFKAWLRGIVKHKIADMHRRRIRSRIHEGELPAAGLDSSPLNAPMDEAFEIEWQQARLTAALDIIAKESDPAVFQAFQLCAIDGRDARDVSRLLGITRNAVYISKTRIIKKLKVIVDRLEAEEG